ncbi:MAG: Mur ligase family protein [Candidatus Woesebacteria bacterium]|nr:Mur ligase family protein [Candidatus Woesebacteria bacterium]
MKNIHMMGISGSGMGGVAQLASKMGYTVTGCDLKTGGHNKEHLNGIDLLIVSPAVLYQSKNEPELLIAKKKKIVMTWEEFVGKVLMKDKFVIAIAGTHGKSTTTAMIGKMMTDNGFDPTVLLGAKVLEWNGNSRFGKSKYFVIEADEFNDSFLYYHPDIAVINNIEFDHPDYFDSEKQLFESFNKFIGNLKDGGTLIVNWDDDGVKALLSKSDLKSLKKVRPSQVAELNLKVIGNHNQNNAQMVLELGKVLGISEEKIIQSLENFEGIGRRMEEIGKNIFDDYAHHPTAIKTTLAGVRNKYPNAKIWAIIEPHGFLRTKALLTFYKDAFVSVDKVIIGPIFKARDKETFDMTPEKIKEVSNHKNIYTANSIDQIVEIIKEKKENNDLFVVMGAGNSNIWAKKISEILHR